MTPGFARPETIARSLWAIELPHAPTAEPDLPMATLTGGVGTYEACRAEARRLRKRRAAMLVAPSAALLPDASSGFRTDGGLRPAPSRAERVFVLFGRRPDRVGWLACAVGRPRPDLLERIRPLAG